MSTDLSNTPPPIAGYTPTERIGAGGYGEVWKADAPGGLAKAIKFVYGRMDDTRAERELKALNRIKQVRHPFLLSLERIEIIDGRLSIVTELADMSLKDRYEICRAEGLPGVPRDELLYYLRDAADALDYMSEQFGLQHLDVKPENLLLVGGHVKVADFGLVKDLHEASISLVGALTPVYASPEMFDDRASSHSDQYSLAIVYQEMLTGVLPFPGRTPAQLAAQHLNSRAMLSPLPEQDRPVIARALAKNPTQRFAGCREMVEGLLSAGRSVAAVEAAPRPQAPPEDNSKVETATTTGRSTEPRGRTPPSAEPGSAAPDTPSPQKTEAANESAARKRCQPGKLAAPRVPHLVPAPAMPSQPATVLPPVEMAGSEIGWRPTLFIGIGGAAGRVLSMLRGRLHQRFGDAETVPSFRMLLLDTDRKALAQAMNGRDGTALSARETVGLPLRNPVEYRTDSHRFLHWLSRRWLYNVPRSLETEGIRPLGRLALVDHAETVISRIRKILTAMTSDESLTASNARTGLPLRDRSPRIFIVAATSGGTGSGMVVDMGFLVRSVLRELKLRDDGVCAVLAHCTGSSPNAQDLQRANTLACLDELYHFSRGASGPANSDSSVVENWDVGGPPFEDVYFAHLGDGGEPSATEIASLAAYLYWDATTAAGSLLDKYRDLARATGGPQAEPNIRSFGTCAIHCDLGPALRDETRRLCERLVRHWCDDREQTHAGSSPSSEGSHIGTNVGPRPSGDRVTIDVTENECIRTLLEDVEGLRAQSCLALEKKLGGDVEAFVRRMIDGGVRGKRGSETRWNAEKAVRQVLASLTELLSPSEDEAALNTTPTSAFDGDLSKRRSSAMARFRDGVRRDVSGLFENPRERLGGAQFSLSRFEGELTTLVDEIRGAQQQAENILRTRERELVFGSTDTNRKSRGWFGRRQPARSEVEKRLVDYCRLRVETQAIADAQRLVESAQRELARLGDELSNIRRALSPVVKQFANLAAAIDQDETAASAGLLATGLVDAIRSALESELPALTIELDTTFQNEFIAEHGGLLKLVNESRNLHAVLPDALYLAAWRALRGAIKRIDAAGLLLKGGDDYDEPVDRLRACITEAIPPALASGSEQRLLLMVPEGPSAGALDALVDESIKPQPNVLHDTDRALVAIREGESLPLAQLAARVLDGRMDLLEIAGRIHTRSDIDWTPLPVPSPFGAVQSAS